LQSLPRLSLTLGHLLHSPAIANGYVVPSPTLATSVQLHVSKLPVWISPFKRLNNLSRKLGKMTSNLWRGQQSRHKHFLTFQSLYAVARTSWKDRRRLRLIATRREYHHIAQRQPMPPCPPPHIQISHVSIVAERDTNPMTVRSHRTHTKVKYLTIR